MSVVYVLAIIGVIALGIYISAFVDAIRNETSKNKKG